MTDSGQGYLTTGRYLLRLKAGSVDDPEILHRLLPDESTKDVDVAILTRLSICGMAIPWKGIVVTDLPTTPGIDGRITTVGRI